jgi:hypothetical protein
MVNVDKKINDDITIKHVKDKFTLLKQIMKLIPADMLFKPGKVYGFDDKYTLTSNSVL